MTSPAETAVLLFSYGTLRQPEVQRATFGRLLDGTPDVLPGYRVAPVRITDPHVIATSGSNTHNIALPTGDSRDLIAGIAYRITPAELAAADAYEVGDYRRVEVGLRSGRAAWAYVKA